MGDLVESYHWRRMPTAWPVHKLQTRDETVRWPKYVQGYQFPRETSSLGIVTMVGKREKNADGNDINTTLDVRDSINDLLQCI
jgi:hypothetical protein